MKSSVTLQDRLIKQNEISRQKLAQELVKLEKLEKSDLRMIETERHRFRSRHKNLQTRRQSSGSNAVNVRMYETHNPGFCYHCTGAIKETGSTTKQRTLKDCYEFVRSILFTNDEIDPRKVLCLHLLTAHSTRWNNNDDSTVRPVALLLEKARKKHFSGAWNNVLPCYVVDTEEASSVAETRSCDQAIRDFEDKYRRYVDDNVEFGRALSTNAKQTRVALHGFEKMPPITPHVYSLLGPSHELRIKQALAEGVSGRKWASSSTELIESNEKSSSFRLDDDDDDDDPSSRTTTNVSNGHCLATSTRSPSNRSAFGSIKLDRGITMLKSKRSKLGDRAGSKRDHRPKGLITVESSFESPFRAPFENQPSTHTLLSTTFTHDATNKYRKCVYLNTPAGCAKPTDKDRKIVPILVNYQIQALVQAVLEVLERVNPEKSRNIIETARNTEEIKEMLLRPEMQNFAQSLSGQSLVSSAESYVISTATVADEMDFRFERILEKEIIALTLEIPSVSSLYALIAEIRNNIFFDARKKTQPNENTEEKISSPPKEQKIECWKDDGKSTLNLIETLDESESKEDPKKRFDKIKKPLKRANNKRRDSRKRNEKKKLPIQKQGADYVGKKSNEDDIVETKYEPGPMRNSKTKASEQRISSENIRATRTSNAKTWKAAQDLGHLDADRVILRRMTNTQRILVGQMCASLKSKRINNQGLINESVPLAALITPALSRDSIKLLTRGTVYAKTETVKKLQEGSEDNVAVPDKLTGPLLAKIRQDVAENETKQRLKHFLKRKTNK